VPALERGGESTPSLWRAIRQHAVLILASTLIFTAVAGLFALRRAPTYTATASVLLRPLAGTGLSPELMGTLQQITGMTTEAALVNSTPVVAGVNETLGTNLVAGTAQVTAKVPPNTQIIVVQFKARTPVAAKEGAQAFATSLLSYRSEESASTQKGQLVALQRRIRIVEARLADATARNQQQYADELAQLRASVAQLNAGGTNPGEVVNPARLPSSPSNVNPWFLIALAGLLGLGIGMALALGRQRSGDRGASAAATSVAGVPILATLPLGRSEDTATVARSAPDSPFTEMFQEVRAGVLALAPPPRAVTVTATDSARAADFVGVNLAQSLAHAGYRVALVSTAEHSTVETMLDIDPSPGLSDILAGRGLAAVAVNVYGLTVVPSGGVTEHRSDMLASRGFSQIVTDLQKEADYVLVIGGPLSAPNAMAVALPTDGIVLTGHDGATTGADVEAALSRAQVLDIPVIGLVLVAHSR